MKEIVQLSKLGNTGQPGAVQYKAAVAITFILGASNGQVRSKVGKKSRDRAGFLPDAYPATVEGRRRPGGFRPPQGLGRGQGDRGADGKLIELTVILISKLIQ